MSNSHSRVARFIVSFIVVVLVGIGIAFALLRGPKRGADIQITPDISMHLVAVLTAKNPVYDSPDGLLSVPARYVRSRPVQWINRFLPPKVRLRPRFSIDARGLSADEMRLVYKLDYPGHWNASRNVTTLERDLSAAIKGKKIEIARVKIADGTYDPRPSWINKTSHSSSYSASPGGGSSTSGFISYLEVTIKAPPFLRELVVDFGENQYSNISHGENFEVAASDRIDNPLWQTVTPLTNPVALPATQRAGDYEVTLRGAIARVQRGLYITYTGQDSRMEYVKGKPLLSEAGVILDRFPAGKASDPGGYSSTIIMTLQKNGGAQDEWRMLNPKLSYGKEEFPLSTNSASHFENTYAFDFDGDISVYPGPIKISTQLQHVSNYLPEEMDTIELALPKEGELLKINAKLATWGKKATVLALGYKTTQTVTLPPIAVSGRPFTRTANTTPDSFFVLTSGSGVPKNVVLRGPGGASLNVNGSAMHGGYGNANLMQYKLEPLTSTWGEPVEVFNYADYTSVSLTMIDGRTSPVLYEFVVTPQIATGERVVKEE